MKLLNRLIKTLLLFSLIWGPACTGEIVPPEQAADTGNDIDTCQVDASPLRRLSHYEYTNTLADLFPNTEIPVLSLPEDERPHEFDNDATSLRASQPLVTAYSSIASDISQLAIVAENYPGCDGGESELVNCGRDFVSTLGKRVFRRPLDTEEIDFFSRFFSNAPLNASFSDRQQLTIQLMLAAPEFLYRFERPLNPEASPGTMARLDSYSMASRLSYFLWGTMPDEELLSAAAASSLSTQDGIRTQVARMVSSPRARKNFTHFHSQWLDFDRIFRTTKADSDQLDSDLRDALIKSAEMFVDKVLYEEGGTIEDLFSSNQIFVNQRLADVLGETMPTNGNEWEVLELAERAGILTHPLFLTSHGHPERPSPVLRGVFVLERVLCTELGAPPADANAVGMTAGMTLEAPFTNRQFYDVVTGETRCQACHARINPAGFAFEQFDTMGRFRFDEASGLTIDPSASFDSWDFKDAKDFGDQLSKSPDVAKCVAKKWVRYAFAGGPMEGSNCLLEELMAELEAGDGSIRELMALVAGHSTFATFAVPRRNQ